MTILALVRARLFGMRILPLEARVVVGTDDGLPAVIPPLVLSPHGPSTSNPRSSQSGLASAGTGPGLVRAIELLTEGTDTLERSRRPR